VEAPREIKSFPYFMAWHPRLNNEPAHKWSWTTAVGCSDRLSNSKLKSF